MGATTFKSTAQGANAKAAFIAAREQALYDYGHSGYTGTIAEKHEFTTIPYHQGTDGPLELYIERLIEQCDPRIDDKWGPAGCIDLGSVQDGRPEGIELNEYVFFGRALE